MKKDRFCKGCGTTPVRADNTTGWCVKCLRSRSQKAQRPSDTLDVKGDVATLTKITSETVRTLADLVRVCQIDTEAWIVKRWSANTWQMGAKDHEGNLTAQTLYQIKAHLEANRVIAGVKAEIASLLADAHASLVDARSAVPVASRHLAERVGTAHLLEIAIPDLHLGKLAWKPETGYSDYDVKIAEKLFDTALEALIERTKHFTFDRIVFPLGNDLLHADNKHGTTTKGTPLDTDSRYHKAFGIVRRMSSRAIDRLRQIAPVDVKMISGNHDELGVFFLGDSLSCLFHNTPGVTIDNAPTLRKSYAYGRCAFLYTHGNKGKSTDWPLLFATEQPKMFGSALYREIHVGHLHQTRTTEYHGVRVRISPALCSSDAWHSDNQFVGNLRGAEALVWHPEEGLVATAHFSVKE